MPSATAREFQRVARNLGIILKAKRAVTEDGIILMGESRPYLSTVERKSDRLYSIKFSGNWAAVVQFGLVALLKSKAAEAAA